MCTLWRHGAVSEIGERIAGYLNINNDLPFLCNSFTLPDVFSEWNRADAGKEKLRVQTDSGKDGTDGIEILMSLKFTDNECDVQHSLQRLFIHHPI